MPTRPLIGVTCANGTAQDWDDRWTLSQARLNLNYADAIYLAGAVPALLPTPGLDPGYFDEGAPPPPPEEGEEIRPFRRPAGGWPPKGYLVGKGRVPAGTAGGGVDGVELYLPLARECLAGGIGGLLLSGGGDVGADPRDKPGLPRGLANQDKARDRWEAALFFAALEAGFPVLGVCRGLQLMNVALGGTLWEDIGTMVEGAVEHRQRIPRTRPTHEVTLSPGSIIAGLAGGLTVQVNTGHHQGIRWLGHGLVVTGNSSDGLIEAVELPGFGFVLGVQWHPEGLARSDPGSLALFCGLVDAARAALAAHGKGPVPRAIGLGNPEAESIFEVSRVIRPASVIEPAGMVSGTKPDSAGDSADKPAARVSAVMPASAADHANGHAGRVSRSKPSVRAFGAEPASAEDSMNGSAVKVSEPKPSVRAFGAKPASAGESMNGSAVGDSWIRPAVMAFEPRPAVRAFVTEPPSAVDSVNEPSVKASGVRPSSKEFGAKPAIMASAATPSVRAFGGKPEVIASEAEPIDRASVSKPAGRASCLKSVGRVSGDKASRAKSSPRVSGSRLVGKASVTGNASARKPASGKGTSASNVRRRSGVPAGGKAKRG
ncbi:MAG: gamma-glutamyl-gamma-aminobutyrate hydrolase family protein [Deltaproteobacteria bacterium]|nr:gamma-glutamyl-gamma-aminobutyrate hydrolase family protein [Deltaproteobacteria bacterium]